MSLFLSRNGARDARGTEVYPGCDGKVCLPNAELCATRKNQVRTFYAVVYFRRTSEDDIHICASCCGVESRHFGSAAITFSFSYFSSPLEDNYSVQWCILIFKDFDVLAKLELYNPLSGKNHDSK